MLQPNDVMQRLQNEHDMTSLMVLQEALKTAPFGDVWQEYLKREHVQEDYLLEMQEYEQKVLVNRQ